MHKYSVEPLVAVGFEGFYGALTIVLLAPVMYAMRDVSPFFDLPRGWAQMTGNPRVLAAGGAIALSIACFNFCGLSVTRHVSATARSVIDNIRTLCIWLISLVLGWEHFVVPISFLQVLGFTLVVYGTVSSCGSFRSKPVTEHYLRSRLSTISSSHPSSFVRPRARGIARLSTSVLACSPRSISTRPRGFLPTLASLATTSSRHRNAPTATNQSSKLVAVTRFPSLQYSRPLIQSATPHATHLTSHHRHSIVHQGIGSNNVLYTDILFAIDESFCLLSFPTPTRLRLRLCPSRMGVRRLPWSPTTVAIAVAASINLVHPRKSELQGTAAIEVAGEVMLHPLSLSRVRKAASWR